MNSVVAKASRLIPCYPSDRYLAQQLLLQLQYLSCQITSLYIPQDRCWESKWRGCLTALYDIVSGITRRTDLEMTEECVWAEICNSEGFNIYLSATTILRLTKLRTH